MLRLRCGVYHDDPTGARAEVNWGREVGLVRMFQEVLCGRCEFLESLDGSELAEFPAVRRDATGVWRVATRGDESTSALDGADVS